MRKLVCLVMMVVLSGVFMFAGEKQQTMNGWITDSSCATKVAKEGTADPGCVTKCISSGKAMVLVTDADKKVLEISNPDTLKGHEGHHVAVTGTVGKDGKLMVSSASMIEEKGK